MVGGPYHWKNKENYETTLEKDRFTFILEIIQNIVIIGPRPVLGMAFALHRTEKKEQVLKCLKFSLTKFKAI